MALADFRNSIVTKDQFSQTFNKFDRSVQTSARGLDKLGGVLSSGGLGMLFGGVAGAAGVAAITKTAFALGDLGAQSLTTKASFDNLMRSIGASPVLLNDLTEAAGGTMTQMTLMQQANTALAGTTGQLANEMAAALPRLLEAGKAAAKLNPAYGDASFMFQSLVAGVKRGTPMLIDNTGIVLKIGEATEAYAQSIGKSVTQLTAQERSIAILRATLAGADTLINQAGGSMENMAAKSKQLKVAIEELKTAIGEKLAPTTSAIQGAAAEEINRLTSILNSTEATRAIAMLEMYRERLAALQAIPEGKRTTLDVNDILDAQAAIQKYATVIGLLIQEESRAAIQSAQTSHVIREYSTSATIAANGIGALTFSLRQAKEAALGLGGAMGGLPADYKAGLNTAFSSVYGMGSMIPAGDADRIYGAYTKAYAQLELDKTNLTRAEYTRRKADLDAALSDQLASYRKFAGDVGALASDMSADLKNRIGSALSPTFDLSSLTGGLLGGQMGDTFDEAYKRLAAVALRPEELQIHAQDWAGTFEQAGLTGLTPEEAQARAKELVEAYSRGLDFSLIDREKIKDQVRQAIKAEELYNSIVDEIYAEMGKENQRLAQAATAMGNQMNKYLTTTVQSGASEYVGAWLDILTPAMIRRLAEMQRRGGLPWQ